MNKINNIVITGLLILSILTISAGVYVDTISWDHNISILLKVIGLFILVFAFTLLGKNKMLGKITEDERTKTLHYRALAISWIVLIYLIFVIFWLDYLEIVKMQLSTILCILMSFAIVVAAIAYQLLLRGIYFGDLSEK